MKLTRFGVVLAALVFVAGLAVPAFGQSPGDPSDRPVDLEQNRQPIETVDPTPEPAPIPNVSFTAEEPQLVGYTRAMFTGNRGVLNFTLACQREFVGSRMCTMEEVNKSTMIPRALRYGQAAWVQNLNASPEMNCRGWMSASGKDLGTSIDLGLCLGGQHLTHCDQQLAVACCARSGKLAAW